MTSTEIVISGKATGAVAAFNKAAASARTSASQITSAFRGVNTALASVGAGVSFAGLGLFVKASIDAADALNDISKRTGVAATTIGGIGFAAEQAGGDLAGATLAFKAFNKVISDAIGGNREAVENFYKLGITLRDLQTLSPDRLLIKAADAFNSFADGAEKAAAAQVFFGRASGSVAALMDEGGASLQRNIEYFKRYSGVTDELVRASDEFNDSLTKIKVQTNALGNSLAQVLLKPMQEVANYLLRAAENGDQFKTVAEQLAQPVIALGKAAVIASFGIKALGEFADVADAQGDRLLRFDFKGAYEVGKKWADQQRANLSSLLELLDRMNGKVAASRSGFGGAGADSGVGGPGGKLKTPNFSGGGGGKSGAQAVDEYARHLERVRKITADAQSDLDALFTSDKLTAAGKALAQLLQDDSFQKLPERQRQHIAGFYATAIAIEKETEALKLARKEREEQDEAFESARQRHATDVKQLQERVDQYTQSNRLLSFEIDLVGKDEAARQKLAAAIEYETLAREANELGAKSELDALQEQLRERLRLIDDLAAKVQAFNNTEQIRSIFADSFSDEISQVISGTKSLSDAFRDMERQIVQSISRIAAQNIAEAVFGKSGAAGGFGDFASWLGQLIPAFANGTSYAPGGMALVGERGPEIVNLPRGSKVTPNDRIVGNVISINVNVPGGTSRASADQIALQTGIAVKRAVARIG